MTAALWIAVCAATLGQAQQVLYKWTDASGKTQYSDRPPKDFKGEVTRIETDAQPATVIVPKKAQDAVPDDTARVNSSDYLAKTRARRAELEAGVARARESLEAARKALAETSDPGSDEVQVIQNRGDNNGGKDSAKVGRANCRQVADASGKAVTICPGLVPSPEYYDRIAQLEEAVRKAEENLAAAQDAYRRGVN